MISTGGAIVFGWTITGTTIGVIITTGGTALHLAGPDTFITTIIGVLGRLPPTATARRIVNGAMDETNLHGLRHCQARRDLIGSVGEVGIEIATIASLADAAPAWWRLTITGMAVRKRITTGAIDGGTVKGGTMTTIIPIARDQVDFAVRSLARK
jgi:hypothetical protein